MIDKIEQHIAGIQGPFYAIYKLNDVKNISRFRTVSDTSIQQFREKRYTYRDFWFRVPNGIIYVVSGDYIANKLLAEFINKNSSRYMESFEVIHESKGNKVFNRALRKCLLEMSCISGNSYGGTRV